MEVGRQKGVHRGNKALLFAAIGLAAWGAGCAAKKAAPPAVPEAQAAAPTPSPTPSLTLAAGGDVTLASHYQEWIDEKAPLRRWSHKETLSYGFSNVRELTRAADLFFINLEQTFTTRGKPYKKTYTFRARPELVETLVDAGVDVVSLSNNHTWDYGDEGILDSIETLRRAGISQAGAGANGAQARSPVILEKNGITVGFLAYSAVGRYDVNQPETGKVYDTSKPGIAACVRDWPCLKRIVTEDVHALSKLVDVPVVSFHWGVEKNYNPEPFQVELAHRAVDAGAKLILGHHPHVLQGVELYRKAVIFYSLGNFVFGGNWTPADPRSLVLLAKLDKEGVGGVEIKPLHVANPPKFYFQPYFVEGAEAEGILNHLADHSRDFPQTLPELEKRAARPWEVSEGGVRALGNHEYLISAAKLPANVCRLETKVLGKGRQRRIEIVNTPAKDCLAGRLGFLAGDQILSVNGQKTLNLETLIAAGKASSPQSEIRLLVLRKKKTLNFRFRTID